MNTGNFVLDSLPLTDYTWLKPKLKNVELQQGNTLSPGGERFDQIYFPTTCLLSWTISAQMGEVVEIGVTGKEGLAGFILLLEEDVSPWATEVQLSGAALRLSAKDFVSALEMSITLQRRVAAFTYLKMVQVTQSALCNRFHTAEARLCRWLLTARAQTGLTKFSLTQEILAQMIGTGRPTVSLSMGILQAAGLIRTHRGEITILDAVRMEDAACECHQVVQRALNHYLDKVI